MAHRLSNPSYVRQILLSLPLLSHQTKTAVPNWFRHRSFAVLNSSVRFGTWVERRLNRAYLSQQKAAQTQQRSYSINKKSFSSMPTSTSERKALLAGCWRCNANVASLDRLGDRKAVGDHSVGEHVWKPAWKETTQTTLYEKTFIFLSLPGFSQWHKILPRDPKFSRTFFLTVQAYFNI